MLFSKFQQEILEVMSKGKGNNSGEAKAIMPKVSGTFQKIWTASKSRQSPY